MDHVRHGTGAVRPYVHGHLSLWGLVRESIATALDGPTVRLGRNRFSKLSGHIPTTTPDGGLETLSVEVDVTRKDVAAIYTFAIPRQRASWIFFAILWAAFTLINRSQLELENTIAGTIALLIVSGLPALVVFVFSMFIGLAATLIHATKQSGVLGSHEFEITRRGLYERTVANETLTSWSAISNVWITRRFIAVLQRSLGFHVLPRRCFDSDVHYRSFGEALVSTSKGG